MEAKFQRLECGQDFSHEDAGPSYSADHSGKLITVIKKVKESAVARAKAAHEADLDHQRYHT